MKTLLKLSTKSAFKTKNGIWVIVGIALSAVILTVVCSTWQMLIDFEDLIVYDIIASKGNYTVAETTSLIKTYPPRVQICNIAVIFCVVSSCVAAAIVYGSMHAKKNELTKTVSLLSCLGIKPRQKTVFLLLQAMLPFCVAFPIGTVSGMLIAKLMLDDFNGKVCNPMGYDNIAFLGDRIAFYIALIFALCALSVLAAAATFAAHVSKHSPIVTSRFYGKINVSLKETRIDKHLQSKYKICAKLGKSNYYNNKAKYRIFAIIISCASFLCVSLSLSRRYLAQGKISSNASPAVTDNFISQFTTFVLIVALTSLFAAACCFCADFAGRDREFAILKTLGADGKTVFKALFIESLYHMVNVGFYISVLNVSAALLLFFVFKSADSRSVFEIPALEWAISIVGDSVMTLTLCVFMCASAKRIKPSDCINSLF